MSKQLNNWICCQIGNTQDYQIAKALHSNKRLKYLITDAWLSYFSPFNFLPKILLNTSRSLEHPELSRAKIKAFNDPLLIWEISQKFDNIRGWEYKTTRSSWWQAQVIKILSKTKFSEPNITLYAQSYAASELFKYAKHRGWKTVLGQTDPGIIEEKLLIKESQIYPQYHNAVSVAPLDYWQKWREECTLADQIIVNSAWSAQALIQTGVASDKIKIIPLAYQATAKNKDFNRTYPQNFSQQRPLKVAFVADVILRHGVAAIFEAMELLTNKPIELWMVGKIGIKIPKALKKNPKIKWFNTTHPHKIKQYYQQADVLLFPSLSDNFGINQLQAQEWQLPIISSKHCANVVKDKINGLILPEVSAMAIADALSFCQTHPQQLTAFAQASQQTLIDFERKLVAEKLGILNYPEYSQKSLIHYQLGSGG
ncbi:group 1 glycosyl transferase [Chondrocystis sp. NIES-4102]|nr:group 1 glycosyl transferase [Chondrocystis sp. NIES-4102]